ncbi:YSIRK-type signal peptide-containing protein [Streptococcus suis]
MRKAKKKSFNWYGMKQHFSIRKYHFGAASVLLGMSLVMGLVHKLLKQKRLRHPQMRLLQVVHRLIP